jgi:hypothetical protein
MPFLKSAPYLINQKYNNINWLSKDGLWVWILELGKQ